MLSPRKIFKYFKNHSLLTIILLIVLISLFGGMIFYHLESKTIGESLWWVVVSITSVGYGDIVPVTSFGRLLGGFIILTGLVLFSTFTAIVSSIFVTQRLKEERGLKQITEKNHIILCGWNHTAEQILRVIFQKENITALVLINQLPEEQIQNIFLKFKQKPLHFIRGDFGQEEILNRANITKADTVIIIPDASAGLTTRSDEKTILTAFSVKAIHPKIKVYAHILDRDNEPYLKKAQVEDYIISDSFSGVLLGEMVTSPGIPLSIQQLIRAGDSGNLTQQNIPPELVGKTFGEAITYFRRNRQLPIAIVKEQKALSLSQIISEDYSDLDKFIERKFKEAGINLKKGDYLDVQINPADATVLEEDLALIVIK